MLWLKRKLEKHHHHYSLFHTTHIKTLSFTFISYHTILYQFTSYYTIRTLPPPYYTIHPLFHQYVVSSSLFMFTLWVHIVVALVCLSCCLLPSSDYPTFVFYQPLSFSLLVCIVCSLLSCLWTTSASLCRSPSLSLSLSCICVRGFGGVSLTSTALAVIVLSDVCYFLY